MWFLFPLALVAIGAGIAYRRRATLDVVAIALPRRARVLRVGAAARRLRQGAGVEPAAAAVLVPDAVPARGARCRRDRALGRARSSAWVVVRRRATATSDRRRSRRPSGRGSEPADHRVTRSPCVDRSWSMALFATVALVRVQRDPRATSRTGPSTTTRATKAERSPTSRRSRTPSTGRSWTPPPRCRRAACCGSRARRSAAYGTPLALMLLPYWTDGRITSMEGLYYESAGTTAVPLPGRGHAHADAVEPGARAPVPHDRRLRPRRAVPPAPRRAVLRGDARHARTLAGGQPRAARGRDGARPRRRPAERLDDLRGRRLRRSVSPLRVRAGRGERTCTASRTGSARASRSRAPGTPGVEELSAVGVPRGAVVRRSRRARPPAHRRRAGVPGSGADMADARQVAKQPLPDVKVSNIRTHRATPSSSTCRAPVCR